MVALQQKIPRISVRRIFLLLLVFLLVAVATLFLRRPWAATALQEGFPSRTWPAEGSFTQQGNIEPIEQLPLPILQSTADFQTHFERSKGSAVLVIKNGEIVYSQFADGFSFDTKFNSYSMAKSLVAALTIKAISDGKIASIDATVGELWPEAQATSVADVTVRELLDMRSGLSFEQDPGTQGDANADLSFKNQAVDYGPFSKSARLHIEGVDAILNEVDRNEADRGTFLYQNLNTAILGRVLETVYAKSIDELLYEKIVVPAEAGGFHWRLYTKADQHSAYCCIYATAQWWAEVARYLMNNGAKQEPFLSQKWFHYFRGDDIAPDALAEGTYRSQIRYNILDRPGEDLQGRFHYFSGQNGQITYYVPDEDLLVVRFGEQYQLLHSTLYQIANFEPL